MTIHDYFSSKGSYISCAERFTNATENVTNLGDFDGCTYIASPFYPTYAYWESDCVWTFTSSDPQNVIQIEMLDWEMVRINLDFLSSLTLLIDSFLVSKG